MKKLTIMLFCTLICAFSPSWAMRSRKTMPISPQTKLLRACVCGSIDNAVRAVKKGADLHKVDRETGQLPLHVAVENGFPEVAEWLLIQGVPVNATDKTESTALHYAAQEGHTPVVHLLLRWRANIDATDDLHKTPLDYATEYEKHETALVIRKERDLQNCFQWLKVLNLRAQEGNEWNTPEDSTHTTAAIDTTVTLPPELKRLTMSFLPST